MNGWNALPLWLRVVISSVVAFLTSVSAISAGLVTIEPWIPAHRQLLRDSIAVQAAKDKQALEDNVAETKRIIAPTKIGMYDIQISIARSRRSTINDQIVRSEIEAPKSDNPDELIKRRQQIQALKDELADVDGEIKVLRDQRERN